MSHKLISKEFQTLERLFPWGNYKKTISYPSLNIYSDVAPYQETAVFINFPENMSREQMTQNCKKENYINASHIKSAHQEHRDGQTPFGLIIATQGPQHHTLSAFWQMIVQYNITKIVTLCHNISNDDNEADAVQYFPNESVDKIKTK